MVVQATLTRAVSPSLVSPVAANCTVAPASTVASAGVTTTLAPLTARTTTLTKRDLSSAVALIEVLPVRRALKVIAGSGGPTGEAMLVLLTFQTMTRLRVSLARFFAVAVNRNWSPTNTIWESGTTVILATTSSTRAAVAPAKGASALGVVVSPAQANTRLSAGRSAAQ